MKEWLKESGAVCVFFVVFVVLSFGIFNQDKTVTYDDCSTESIPYETTEVGDTYDQDADIETEVEGVNGEKEICEPSESGYDSKETIISSPVNEVIRYTSKPEEDYEELEYPYQETGSYRTGAICSDGSYSDATGRGACSWHGGVSQWLY